jgi:phosphoglycolate phosphatase-like HAD superfamily hydrolase
VARNLGRSAVVDGVLVDSRVPFARSVNSALTSHGLAPRPEHELHQYLGPPLHQTFRALVGEESLVQPCARKATGG